MSIWEAILLGIVQGATEFLPISSDGHLVLIPDILNLTQPDLVFIGLIHLGTLIAVLAYFRHDLWTIIRGFLSALWQRRPLATTEARLGWFILVGSIPVGVVGLTLKDLFERVFGAPPVAAFFLLVTAALLVLGERLKTGTKTLATIGWLDALIIGFSQVLALLPGLSRSGSTITGGLVRGLDRPTAARFSFLLGVPAVLAAGLLSVYDALTMEATYELTVYIAAFLAATIAGFACIHLLLAFVKKHSLYVFAFYCAVFGSIYLLVTLLGK
jgi:undecaprenyl-diphosphatase